ncbi:MAG: hypothetical protein OXC05_16365, partial [Halieaceae bacterium]|nr:hypothetical protein [Halieaceae bacterium]
MSINELIRFPRFVTVTKCAGCAIASTGAKCGPALCLQCKTVRVRQFREWEAGMPDLLTDKHS